MPLRAFIDGKEALSVDFSNTEWKILKEDVKNKGLEITLTCCGGLGTCKTTKGINYFGHQSNSKACPLENESYRQLLAKAEVINVCRENNWHAIPEHFESNLQTDILATKSAARIAFNICWDKKTVDEIHKNNEIYKAASIRACWLFKKMPKEFLEGGMPIAQKEFPIFFIEEKEGGFSVFVSGQPLNLKGFVKELLSKKIKFCSHMKSVAMQKISITFFKKNCWKCGKEQHSYYTNDSLTTFCKNQIETPGALWSGDKLEFHPKVINEINKFLSTESGSKIILGAIKERYSNTVRDSYMSFGCKYCDSIFGDFFSISETADAQYYSDNIIIKSEIEIGIITEEINHWCYSPESKFCE